MASPRGLAPRLRRPGPALSAGGSCASVSPVRSLTPAGWLKILIVAVSAMVLSEVAISVQLLTEQKAARPCQAAQLRASVASDDGFSGEEEPWSS